MSAADLPIAALRLHPQTERALVRRGIATAGQLAAHTQSSLHQLGVSWRMAGKIGEALQERGLALAPGRRYLRRQPAPAAKPAKPAPAAAATKSARPAPAAAAPAAKPAPAAPARPRAPAIPPLPRLGRVQVRAAAPGAKVRTLRGTIASALERAARWVRG